MFQNLVKYLKGPSAMILRMFSTMYTGRKAGNMVLGFGVIDSPHNWVGLRLLFLGIIGLMQNENNSRNNRY